MKVCPKCGFENADQTVKCAKCGNASSNICQKCGFENISQTFYCSRCGNQIKQLPEKPVEDIDEESLIESEKARKRDDLVGEFVETLLFGGYRSEEPLRKDTVGEKEWKETAPKQKEKVQRRSSDETKQSIESDPWGGQYQDPFEPNPSVHPSAVFNKVDKSASEEMTLTKKREKKVS